MPTLHATEIAVEVGAPEVQAEDLPGLFELEGPDDQELLAIELGEDDEELFLPARTQNSIISPSPVSGRQIASLAPSPAALVAEWGPIVRLTEERLGHLALALKEKQGEQTESFLQELRLARRRVSSAQTLSLPLTQEQLQNIKTGLNARGPFEFLLPAPRSLPPA